MSEDRQQQFTEKFVRHDRQLFGYVITLLPNFDEAEEAYHETCLRLWMKWDDYDPGRDFLAWACGFAKNIVRELRQKRHRGRQLLSEPVMESVAEARFRSTMTAEVWQSRLTDCLAGLSERQRELIARFYGGEASIDVIAAEWHTTPAALYMRLSRIRRLLLECLEQAMNEGVKP